MTGLNRQQRAGLTRRNSSRNALLDAADSVFTDADYKGIEVRHIAGHAAISTATFYSLFSGKGAWGAAVLDRRLNEVLDGQKTTGAETPRARLLGHFGLLDEVSAPLPGITKALIDERIDSQAAYEDILPLFQDEVTQAVADGQGQLEFRRDTRPNDLASSLIDNIALAYAVHLDDPAARAISSSLALDGLRYS